MYDDEPQRADGKVANAPTPPTTPKAEPNGCESIARKRWNILAKALTTHGNHQNHAHSIRAGIVDASSSPRSSAIAHSNHSSHCASPPSSSSSSVSSMGDRAELPHDSEDIRASVRRFASFDLMQQDTLSTDYRDQLVGSCNDWFTYTMSMDGRTYSVNIHHINRPITALDLMGFNNTGNICVWPSEEALAIYTLDRIETFTNKMVLELGGGMTCLAGLLVAKYGRPYGVHLTDGNRLSVANVRKTCRLNDVRDCYVKCSVLQWEDYAGSTGPSGGAGETFDFILSADCLFFDEARAALVDTMWSCLADDGTALAMAPRRGRTLDAFVQAAKAKGFHCQVQTRYNETIWQRHQQLTAASAGGDEVAAYDEDIHYPILVVLTKK